MDRHIMRWHGLSLKNSKGNVRKILDNTTRSYDGAKSFVINQDAQMIDIRLKENFKLFVSGPSRCGKTVF